MPLALMLGNARIGTYPFQNRQIRYHTTSVEVLESIEDDVIAIIRDRLVAISRINRTTNEVIIFYNQLVRAILLFLRANDINRRAPEQMIAKEHANGAITFGDFTDDFVSYIPPLSTTTVLLRAPKFRKTRGFEERYFGYGALFLLLTVGSIFC